MYTLISTSTPNTDVYEPISWQNIQHIRLYIDIKILYIDIIHDDYSTFFEYKLIYLGQQNKGIKGLPN